MEHSMILSKCPEGSRSLSTCPNVSGNFLIYTRNSGILFIFPRVSRASQSVQVSLKSSTSTQGTRGTVSAAQSTLKHLTFSQITPRFFPYAHGVQGSVSSSWATGSFLYTQYTEDEEHSPSAPGSQQYLLSVPGS